VGEGGLSIQSGGDITKPACQYHYTRRELSLRCSNKEAGRRIGSADRISDNLLGDCNLKTACSNSRLLWGKSHVCYSRNSSCACMHREASLEHIVGSRGWGHCQKMSRVESGVEPSSHLPIVHALSVIISTSSIVFRR
jgi:hypothetical protein